MIIMTDKASSVKKIFDRIAPVYDQLNDRLSFGLHRIWKQMTVSWSGAKAGDIGLDLCCGSGDLTFLLAQTIGPTGQVYGLDFSPEQLAIAQQKENLRVGRMAKITWRESDALHLPWQDNYFDCITMGYGLRNVASIPQCLEEIQRVLKPGATAAILDFHRPANQMIQQVQKWYLEQIVVPAAQNLSVQSEYAYIDDSLQKFPTGKEQKIIAENLGFAEVKHYTTAGDMMGVLVIRKSFRNMAILK